MPPNVAKSVKVLKGTLRKSKTGAPRSAADVEQDITDTREAIAAMHTNLRMATADILENGMTVETTVTDSHGKAVTAQRINPAFKVQREALAALRSFKRYLVILEEELESAKPDKTKMTSREQAIAEADRLLAEE